MAVLLSSGTEQESFHSYSERVTEQSHAVEQFMIIANYLFSSKFQVFG